MDSFYLITIPLIAGFFLDLIFGDIHKMPHPVRFFGFLIDKGEQKLNKGDRRVLKGGALAVCLIVACFISFYCIFYYLQMHNYLYYSIASLFVYLGLSNQGLLREGRKVFQKLNAEGVAAARVQLKNLVGRDTSELSEKQIKMAVFESMSENLSDGVVAPVFYYAIGGIPAMFTYKMINTLDSMIGYRNEEYSDFGLWAARIDDIANYIPARMTAIIMVAITLSKRGVSHIIKFAKLHESPNAGYPESALSGIMDTRLGGPSYYHGKLKEKPFIGSNDREIRNSEFKRVILLNVGSSFFLITLITLVIYLISVYL
ncbi:MAG: adenosylcobinamide-phosphate synthase CbiB [Flavobacteriales bacterium]